MTPRKASDSAPDGAAGRAEAQPNAWSSAARYWGAAAALIVLGVVVNRDALRAEWLLDDYTQLSAMTGGYWAERAPLDLHVAAAPGEAPGLIARGALPWWSSADFSFAMLRPLTSLILWWEYDAFGVDPFPAHVASMVWWAALLVAVAWAYRAWLTPGTAMLAFALFTLSRVHSGSLCWVTSRAVFVSALFATLAIAAHVSWWRRGGVFRGLTAAALALLTFLAGESGLGLMGFLLGYQALAGEPSWRARALALAPTGALALGYVGWYVLGGYGVKSAQLYVDPIGDPLGALGNVLGTYPSYVVEGLTGIPLDHGATGQFGWGVCLVGALLLLGRGGSRLTSARWLLLGSLLAVVPFTATFYTARLGVLPRLGFAAVVACFLCDVLERWRAERRRRVPGASGRFGRDTLARTLAAGLAFVQLALAPFVTAAHTRMVSRRSVALAQAARTAPVDGADQVFLLSASEVPIVQQAAVARQFAGLPPVPWQVLMPGLGYVNVARVSSHEIELQTTSDGMFSNPTTGAFRRQRDPMPVGATFAGAGMNVTILRQGTRGPDRMRVRFDAPLDSPRLRILGVTARGYAEVPLPKEDGTQLLLWPAAAIDAEAVERARR